MPENTLCDALLGHQPDDAPFLSQPDGETLSYGGLRSRVRMMAAHLATRGVMPGARVLCQIQKSPEGLILYLATVAAGAIYAPINTAYTGSEVDYFLADADPALFVYDASTEASRDLATARGIEAATPVELSANGPEMEPLPRTGTDLAGILYTSGTTGRSKGAMMSHDNLLSNALSLKEAWAFSANDTLLHALPIFHTHGLFVATNVVLAAGAKMVFLPGFDADAILRHLPNCTSLMGVPTFYTRFLSDSRFTPDTFAQMRLIISGSAPLLAESHRAFEDRFGHVILERYGMTETNMITSNPYQGERRAGTVGHPLPQVSIRLSDQDDAGIGAIEVRGPNVAQGYWRNPEKTNESFTEDGWFITGDLGMIDADGYLSIVGRQKDLVISGGFNIYPKEVEVELDAVPGVLESAVYGIPHEDLGEAVAAAVVLTAPQATNEGEMIAALSGKLARFKIPRSIRIVPELPRNAMGKVQKNVLRDEARNN